MTSRMQVLKKVPVWTKWNDDDDLEDGQQAAAAVKPSSCSLAHDVSR